MFWQAYTARKPPTVHASAYTTVTPSPPGGHGMVPSPVVRHLQRTAQALECIVNGHDAAVFRVLSLVTLTFDLDIQHLSEQGTKHKHVFPVNLAQILSAVPEIFHKQTKSYGQR